MKIFPMLTLLVLVLVLTCLVEDSKATTVENTTPKDTTQHPLEHLHKDKKGVPPPPPPTYKCALSPDASKSYCCYVNDALAPNKVLFSKDFEMKIFPMLTLLVLVLVLTCMVEDSKATTVENGTLKGSKAEPPPHPSVFSCPPDGDRKHFCCSIDRKPMGTCSETHQDCMK
nr:hypothetical protein [Tanacetum cinerariifolium]